MGLITVSKKEDATTDSGKEVQTKLPETELTSKDAHKESNLGDSKKHNMSGAIPESHKAQANHTTQVTDQLTPRAHEGLTASDGFKSEGVTYL